MPTFEAYIDDDRYEVPSLYLINAHDDAGASAAAQRLLDESPHHQRVELRRDGVRLFVVGAPARGEGVQLHAAPPLA